MSKKSDDGEIVAHYEALYEQLTEEQQDEWRENRGVDL